MQCLGRLVRDTPKGVWRLPFEGSNESFHLPIRCDKVVAGPASLCDSCRAKDKATEEMVTRMTGLSVKGGTHPSFLHGRVGEPIPFWSHIYDGAWFRLKIEAGYRVSEENMGKARKAVAAAVGPTPDPEPQPIPLGLKRKGTGGSAAAKASKGEVAATTTTPVQTKLVFPVATAPQEPVKPEPKPIPKPVAISAPLSQPPIKTKKPTTGKKAAEPSAAVIPLPLEPPTAFVRNPKALEPVEDLETVTVRLHMFEGKECYLDPTTNAVYDKQFNLIQ